VADKLLAAANSETKCNIIIIVQSVYPLLDPAIIEAMAAVLIFS
jgi:hypothetical protein